MLTTKSLHASGAVEMADYLAGLTEGQEVGDYYVGRDGPRVEAPGEWLTTTSEALERLGINDEGHDVATVERDDLLAVMAGAHPRTGAPIRRPGPDGTVSPGIDLTMSVPKSVSIAWALGDPDARARIESAQRQAVATTIHALVDMKVARMKVGGREVAVAPDDVVASAWLHTTSRGVVAAGGTPDPHLHTHVVVHHSVIGGQARSIDHRGLMRQARTLRGVYESDLALSLRSQGHDIRAGLPASRDRGTGHDRVGEQWEIAGAPDPLIRDMSKRSLQVETLANEFFATYGRRPAGQELRDLALKQRATKETVTGQDLDGAWHAAAAGRGVEAVRPHPNRAGEVLAETTLADRVQEVLMERGTVHGRQDVIDTVRHQLAGQAEPARAAEIVDHLLATGEVVAVQVPATEPGRDPTTGYVAGRLRRLEEQALADARQLVVQGRHEIPAAKRDVAIRRIEDRLGTDARLTNEQRRAVAALTGPEGLAVLVGEAGAGKGIVIDTVAAAHRASGGRVFGTAVAGVTARRLADGGVIPADRTSSLDALTARVEGGKLSLGPDDLVIVDESSMVDTARLGPLLEHARRGEAKAVLVGDQAQLQSIGAGGLGGIFERAEEVPTAVLNEVRRQRDPEDVAIGRALRAGQGRDAIKRLLRQQRIDLSDTALERDEEVAHAFIEEIVLRREMDGVDADDAVRSTAIVVDGTNKEIDRLNHRVQTLLTELGQVDATKATAVDEARGYALCSGDRVAVTKSIDLGGRVSDEDRRFAKDIIDRVTAGDLGKDWIDTAMRRVQQGRLLNGETGRVTGVGDDGAITLALDGTDQRTVHLAPTQTKGLKLAYAQHVFRQQGATVETALRVVGGGQTDRSSAYVGQTRARGATTVFAAREQLAGPDQTDDAEHLRTLADRLSRDRPEEPSVAYRRIAPRDLQQRVRRDRAALQMDIRQPDAPLAMDRTVWDVELANEISTRTPTTPERATTLTAHLDHDDEGLQR